MGNLIPFKQTFIAGISTRTVSARKLHEFLESKQDFSHWVKNRVKKWRFKDGDDFSIILSKSTNGRACKEYYLTIDMAKMIAMSENSEKGDQARRYFLDCEKKLLESKQQQQLPMKAEYGQRFIIRVMGDKTETTPVPEGAFILTRDQIKKNIHEVVPGYALIKKDILMDLTRTVACFGTIFDSVMQHIEVAELDTGLVLFNRQAV